MTTWTPVSDDPPSSTWSQENFITPLFSPLVYSQMVIGGLHLFSGASSQRVWNKSSSPSSTWTAE